MSMKLIYTDGTQEIKHFATKDAFKWFLGINATMDIIKVVGYIKVN